MSRDCPSAKGSSKGKDGFKGYGKGQQQYGKGWDYKGGKDNMAKRDIRAKAKMVAKDMVKVERDMVTKDLAGPVERLVISPRNAPKA